MGRGDEVNEIMCFAVTVVLYLSWHRMMYMEYRTRISKLVVAVVQD